MTFVICTAGIDLSVGAVVGLSGVCMATAMHSGLLGRVSHFIRINNRSYCRFNKWSYNFSL